MRGNLKLVWGRNYIEKFFRLLNMSCKQKTNIVTPVSALNMKENIDNLNGLSLISHDSIKALKKMVVEERATGIS